MAIKGEKEQFKKRQKKPLKKKAIQIVFRKRKVKGVDATKNKGVRGILSKFAYKGLN